MNEKIITLEAALGAIEKSERKAIERVIWMGIVIENINVKLAELTDARAMLLADIGRIKIAVGGLLEEEKLRIDEDLEKQAQDHAERASNKDMDDTFGLKD